MRIFLRNILICVCFFTTLNAKVNLHPFYVGVSEIQYVGSDSTFKVSIRLFTDDLQKYFLEEGFNFNPDTTKFNASYIHKYFKENFQIILGSKKNNNEEYSIGFKILGWERVEDATWFYLEKQSISFDSKIQFIKIKNTLLYSRDYVQTNIIHFIENGNRLSHQMQEPESIWSVKP
ncbi:MAG: DUF6702 family protein [Bacteroidia bacterium]